MRLLLLVLRAAALTLLLSSAICLVLLRHSGYRLLSVQSASMIPTFRPGDALIVAPVPVNRLQLGEVISYHNPINSKVIISHRLIAIEGNKLTTAGDALGSHDQPFSNQLMIGQAKAILPVFGRVIDWLRRPAGLVILIFLPGVLVICAEIKRLAVVLGGSPYRLYGYKPLE